MRRLIRHSVNALSILSLVLCIATAILWPWSWRQSNEVGYRWNITRHDDAGGYWEWRECSAYLGDGKATLHCGFAGTNADHPRAAGRFWLTDSPGLFGLRWRFEPSAAALKNFYIQARDGAWTLKFPCWLLVLVLAVFPAGTYRLRMLRKAREGYRKGLAAAGRCPHCNYDLRATPDRCPECGRPVASPPAKFPTATP